MTPELRAIVDRFMFDQATFTHIVSSLPADGAARAVTGPGWTIGQLVAHFATSQERYAAAIARWLAGEEVLPPDYDQDTENAAVAELHRDAPLDDSVRRLRESLRALFAAFHRVPDERLDQPFARGTALEAFHAWEHHYLDHALDLIDAAPEVRLDPLVLNWVLHANLGDGRSRDRQRQLLAELRAYYATLDEDEEEDEEEEEEDDGEDGDA